MGDNYGIAPEEKRLLLERQQKRIALRNEFIKQMTNPHRHSGGGIIFDQGIQRFQAMRVSNFEHFKPTGKSFRTGLFTVVLPIVLYGWWIKTDRDKREQEFRTGQVSYRERRFKFI